jgi:hypothetical protein
VLICGENPTYLSVRKDITDIKRMIYSGKNDEIIKQELKIIGLVNQKYRKSSKSWAIRFHLLSHLSILKPNVEINTDNIDFLKANEIVKVD